MGILETASLRARAVASAMAQGGRLIGSAIGGPFGVPQPGDARPMVPPGAYGTDQPPPAPERVSLVAGYHDVTFRTGGYAQHIGGWTVERMRNAIEMGDTAGYFLEAWTLAVACTRFAPIFAALRQRIAPALGLQRRVLGGPRGPARIAREQIEDQLAPRDGEQPSPCFPANLWGAIAISLAMMGFAILQHVHGPPSGPYGFRPVYTRLWPAWAVYFQRYRKTFVAITREAGSCDIIDGDGKWSIICTSDEPFTQGAIRALGPEYLSGGFTEIAQQSYIDAYGNPHPVATMGPNTGPDTPEGRLFLGCVQEFRKPGGVILMPAGAKMEMVEMAAKANAVFDSALSRIVMYIFFALLGNNGSAGNSEGPSVYPSPHLFDAKEEIVRDDTKAITRGVNQGRVRPWVDINIGDVGTYPALDIPLPDPEQDARAKSYGERCKTLQEILTAAYANGQDPTQEEISALAAGLGVPAPTKPTVADQHIDAYGARVKTALDIIKTAHEDGVLVNTDFLKRLCERLEIDPMALASADTGPPIYMWEAEMKLFAPDEIRARKGAPPLPDGAGSLKRLAAERLAGKDEAGAKASQGDPTIDGKPDTVPDGAEPADGETGSGGGGKRRGSEGGGGHQGS